MLFCDVAPFDWVKASFMLVSWIFCAYRISSETRKVRAIEGATRAAPLDELRTHVSLASHHASHLLRREMRIYIECHVRVW